MHELAIADAVLQLVLREAGPYRVARVGMRVGQLRQVVPSSLRFGFELCAAGTNADGAQLDISEVALAVTCDSCGSETRPTGFPLLCCTCGGSAVRVLRGSELLVEWIDVNEEAT